MRTIVTVLLALLFVPLFVAAFLTHSVVGYPFDSSAVITTLQQADTYGALVTSVDLGLKESLEKDEQSDRAFKEKFAAGLKKTLGEAIPEKTFYDMLTQAHAGFASFLDGGTDTAKVDLAPAKQKVLAYFKQVLDEVAADKNPDDVEKARSDFAASLDKIPDTANITYLIAKGNNADPASDPELKKIQEGLATAKTFRAIVMVILAVVFLLIVVASMNTSKRFMISVGICLLLGGFAYMPIMSLGSGALQTAVSEDLKKKSTSGDSAEAQQLRDTFTIKLCVAVVENMMGRCNLPVGAMTILGACMFVAGLMKKPETPVATTAEVSVAQSV
jgi:hypothetical protein